MSESHRREELDAIVSELQPIDMTVREAGRKLNLNRLSCDLTKEEAVVNECLKLITEAIDKMLTDLAILEQGKAGSC